MQMANNTTQQHLRQPTFHFSRKNELAQDIHTSHYTVHIGERGKRIGQGGPLQVSEK